jgi:hypothetical protein
MYTQAETSLADRYPVTCRIIATFGAAIVQPSPPQSQRVLSVALMLTGLVISAIAILADTINIGTGKGFGYYQMIVLIAGIVIFLIGIAVIISERLHGSTNDHFKQDTE